MGENFHQKKVLIDVMLRTAENQREQRMRPKGWWTAEEGGGDMKERDETWMRAYAK